MDKEQIKEKVQEVFREVFDDDCLIISDETSAKDVENWDSLSHLTMINEIECTFGIRIKMKDALNMKNTGELISVIQSLIN